MFFLLLVFDGFKEPFSPKLKGTRSSTGNEVNMSVMLWKYARRFEYMAVGRKWDTYVSDMTNFEEVVWDETFFALVHIEKYESREYEESTYQICTRAKNLRVSMSVPKMT